MIHFWKVRASVSSSRRKFTPEFREQATTMVIETSRPTAQVARELGIGEQTLGNWVSKYRRDHAGEEPALGISERAWLKELERQARELKMENEFLKRCAAYFAQNQP
jgi:transposase